MKIVIRRTSDSHDCETCGSSWAEGANVYIDEELVFSLIPHAHCYDGDNYTDDEVLIRVLEHLGHEVSYVEAE